MPKKECEICNCEEAGKSEFNLTGDLCCQTCGVLLCEDCTLYGYDMLPRCNSCHIEYTKECEEECRGKIKNTICDCCNYC